MYLKQLKLAGFKSFVDPTTVHFPSQLVAVVGPNGCGKSNIIDAVRWVMGESSAKNLRGESMTDVIFNGTSQRKPVGQASVELVFDNSLGRLTGPFANYGELALKRVVTRDGDSTYYLNGSRCRRKDIVDIFLGTGAGPRSYSIIGQGTVSRLVEAKPEELRVFLEEAAGVSKYKERRRETLVRMAQTRENLNRINDIRDELEKQLNRLERQAAAAQRYKRLKEEEHLYRAEILALKWRDLIQLQEVKSQEIQELALVQAQQQASLTSATTQKIQLTEKLHTVTDQLQQVQEEFYRLGTEIARLDETMQQQEREKKRLESDNQNLQDEWIRAQEQLKQNTIELEDCQISAHDGEQHLQKLKADYDVIEQRWLDEQQQLVLWERRWQDLQTAAHQISTDLQMTQVQSQHLKQRQQQALIRSEKIQMDLTASSSEDLFAQQRVLREQQGDYQEQQLVDEAHLREENESCNTLRAQLEQISQQVHQAEDEFHHLNSQHAALVAAQQAVTKAQCGDKNVIQAWNDLPRLMELLAVEPQWQMACELVLHADLHAYVVKDLADLWTQWPTEESANFSIVTPTIGVNTSSKRPRLVDIIQGTIPATVHALDRIYAAQSLAEARDWLPELAGDESIITRDGYWLGTGWLKRITPASRDELGVLARQRQIDEVTLLRANTQEQLVLHRAQRDEYHRRLQDCLIEVEQLQRRHSNSCEALRGNTLALAANEQALEHAQKLKATMHAELQELEQRLVELRLDEQQNSETLDRLQKESQHAQQQQNEFTVEKQIWLTSFKALGADRDEGRNRLHQAELIASREMTKIQQLKDRVNREEERILGLNDRLEQIALQLLQLAQPELDLSAQLAEKVQWHTALEQQLILSQEQLGQLNTELEVLQKSVGSHDAEGRRLSELLGQTRLEEQAFAVRAGAVQESLSELNLNAEQVLATIPNEVTQSRREDELIALTNRIKALGAINLAAIEEFASEQQRKLYLDEQHDDLSQALLTLDAAIERMDSETQTRLANTFEEVNASFKSLFPRLFGGGRAQLELTCDNLLEAGIVVMAQPPGKRISSIHLLSGGEKAMTAVALVFAIFKLNPSPFCMLDEVDAPLDDINVGRFCDLVKEMSQFVQFLFITHNKVTMELAEHLIGVTMREPGVSRLVAVEMKEALS